MNIWWGILNLLPILPLDGGRVTNEAFNICYPRGALQISLWLSLVVATAMAATGLITQPKNWFRILLFGSLAYSSLQMHFGRSEEPAWMIGSMARLASRVDREGTNSCSAGVDAVRSKKGNG